MLKSIIGWGLVFCLVLTGFWYFSIKEHDYSIGFKTPAPPGKIYQKLLGWNYETLKREQNKVKSPFSKIVQKIEVEGFPVSLTWQFFPLSDSLTQVTISVKSQENVFVNRLHSIFQKTSVQKELEKNILHFKKALKADLKFYKVKKIGKKTSPETICACIPLSSKINEKASKMIGNIGFLSDYVLENNLEMAGKPRVQVTNWNLASNQINFEFCFPLKDAPQFPESDKVFIKKIPSQKALKAVFNGNYRDSHQAWFALLNYAEVHGIDVVRKPLEIFHNNPEIEGNSLLWETEIYLPIISKKETINYLH